MNLRLLAGGAADRVEVFRPDPFDLDVQPVRPGVGHEQIVLTVTRELAGAVERAAASEGLPTALWAGIAIESERALAATVRGDSTLADLECALVAAAEEAAPGPLAHRGRRLIAYANAIRTRAPRPPGPVAQRLIVTVAHHTLVAWERAAADGGQPFDQWARTRLERLPTGRARWESSAAESGQTLSEWIAIQAARRWSR